MGTTLLRGGRVIDGSGEAAFNGHILVDNDRISAVLKEGQDLPDAENVIDITGMAVSPGFIDMHSHADWVLPSDDHPRLLKCMLEQGVTTVVTGNCGFSPAPVNRGVLEQLGELSAMLMAEPFDYKWTTMAGFLDYIQETGPIVNMAELVGHASAMLVSGAPYHGRMNPDELQDTVRQVRAALDEGACGLSFGLGYEPGMYSPLDELETLCSTAASAGKPVTVHMKALSKISPCYPLTYLKPHNIRALREMLDIAGNTGVKLQLSHFIFVGRKSWSTAPECLKMVEDAHRGGVDVMIDAFPDTCGNTTIHAPFPYWFLAMGPERYGKKLALARLKIELEAGLRLVGFMYKDFQVMDSAVPGWEDLNGLTIDQIARKWKTSNFKAILRLSKESGGAALMLFHTYSGEPGNEAPLESVLAHDLCLFETDVIIKGSGYPNPVGLGCFPRILGKYVREKKLFSIESAVKRMTSASAERFGLRDRGLLAPGKAADIVVFDPERISDTEPEGAKPAGKPAGIRHVFINGQHAVRDGSYIDGVRNGSVLRI